MTTVKDFADIGDPAAPVGSPEWCKYAHGVLCSSKRRTSSEVSNLKYALLEFRKNERWKKLTNDKGEPFISWEDYVQYPEPNGLGMPPASARLVMEELDDSRLLGDVLRKQGGDRQTLRGEKGRFTKSDKPQPSNRSLRKYGTTRAYILARLDRDGFTDLAVKVRSGDISAKAAAEQMGWQKPMTPLDHIRKWWKKLSTSEREQVRGWPDDL